MVARASERGVPTLALTDHDTIAGLAEARDAGRGLGVRVINGIELSCRVARGSGHVLAYFPDEPPAALAEDLARMEAARAERATRIVSLLTAAGAPLEYEDVARRARGPIGRPHVADALVEAGHARDRADAFARWITPGRPGWVAHGGRTLTEAVRLVREAGGAPVLAHPDSLELSPAALAASVAQLRDAGLLGLEVHRPDHPPTLRNALARLCARMGLVATGGSDFHRPGSDADLGDTGQPPLPAGTASRLLAGAAGERGTSAVS